MTEWPFLGTELWARACGVRKGGVHPSQNGERAQVLTIFDPTQGESPAQRQLRAILEEGLGSWWRRTAKDEKGRLKLNEA
jgi:hypothetical protein